MALPRINISLIDPGALGRPVTNDQIPIYVGVCSAGPTYTVSEYSRQDALAADFGVGHLVDVASHALASGAASVKVCRISDTVAGSSGAPDTDDSLLVDDVTGTLLHFLAVRIEVTLGGMISGGAVEVKYSLDNWGIPNVDPTFSPSLVVPANGTFALGETGLNAVLDTAQTVAIGDFAEFDVTPRHYSSTEVALVTDALRSALAGQHTFVVYTGEAADAAAAATLSDTIEAQIDELFAEARFIGAMAGAGLGTVAATLTAFATKASDPPFLSHGYGAAYVVNPKAALGRGRLGLREHEVAAVRAAGSKISTDLGRTASGALRRVVGTDYDAALEGAALHDARISTLRTWTPAAEGVYITQQRLLSSSVSNFRTWPHAAVMIVALRAAHRVGFLLVLETLRRTPAGTVDARDAKDIEAAVKAELDRVLLSETNARGTRGHVSAIGVAVDPAVLLPSLAIDVRIRPLDWADDIDARLQYADVV